MGVYFVGDGELLKGFTPWSNCGIIIKMREDKWLSAIEGEMKRAETRPVWREWRGRFRMTAKKWTGNGSGVVNSHSRMLQELYFVEWKLSLKFFQI
jgi:hypothetical protein